MVAGSGNCKPYFRPSNTSLWKVRRKKVAAAVTVTVTVTVTVNNTVNVTVTVTAAVNQSVL